MIMKAIIIDQFLPDGARDSGSLDVLNYLSALHKLNYEVSFCSLNSASANQIDGFKKEINIDVDLIDLGSIGRWLVENKENLKIAIVFRYTTAIACQDILFGVCEKAMKILFTSDLHFLREERSSGIHDKNINKLTEIRAKELAMIRKFDASIVVSSYEFDLLKKIDSSLNVYHIPLMRSFIGAKNNWVNRDKAVGFIGGYNHTPNIDAVQYFIDEIFPLVQSIDPEIKFYIAGSNMPESYRNFSGAIVPIGYVEDLSEFFEKLRCSVAPLRFGAGEKGKVLSSLCHGVPVVSTSIGCEGFLAPNGMTGIVIEDDKYRFAHKIIELCTVEGEWNDKSFHAKNFAKTRNGESLVQMLFDIIHLKRKKEISLEPINDEIKLSILLMMKSYDALNFDIVQSWIDQANRASGVEIILLLGEGDCPWFADEKIKLHVEKDYFSRVQWGIDNSLGSNIQVASCDDLVSPVKINQLMNMIRSSQSKNNTYINDYLVYTNQGSNIYHQTFQNYSGVDRYKSFCNSMGAIPAFYSCFPRDAIQKWVHFNQSIDFKIPYADWLLLLIAFSTTNVTYIGGRSPPDYYDLSNWEGLFRGEKSLMNSLKGSSIDLRVFPVLDLYWLNHSEKILSSLDLNVEEAQEYIKFISEFLINRFKNSFGRRLLLSGMSKDELNAAYGIVRKMGFDQICHDNYIDLIKSYLEIFSGDMSGFPAISMKI
jgi:glycosyltransferase involved in cell wall biosynthesis